MLAKDDLSRLLRYTVWANHRIMRSAATLAAADFKRDLGGSHGGKGLPTPARIDESEFADIVALRDRWTVIEEHRLAWFEGLGEDGPASTIHYKTTEGVAFENPLWQLVQHTANHSTYHRGQLTIFLRQLGGRPVATDMIVWDRDEHARAIR